jgi:transcriptional regulator with XRE-family HTH domain
MTGLSQVVTAEIRAEMARQRLSHKALAERLGWDQSQVTRRLNGHTKLSFDDVVAIADALDISIVQLAWPKQIA